MPDLPPTDFPVLPRADADPDNVVPFPPAPKKPVTADEFLGRLDGIDAKLADSVNEVSALANAVGPVARWVEQQASKPAVDEVVGRSIAVAMLTWTDSALTREREARARARKREQAIEDCADDLQQQIAEVAGKVEMLSSPNRDVAELAGRVASGNAEAIDQLASVVLEQPSWWQRNRSWAIPLGIMLGCVVLVAVGVTYEKARRLQKEEGRRRREIEARHHNVEQQYLSLHAAYAEAQRALAAERMRPLESFHTHDHRHETTYDYRSFETTHVADPKEVAAFLLPHMPDAEDLAGRVVRLLPAPTTIVQPTQHTRDRVIRQTTKTKTKVIRVPTGERAAAQAQAAAAEARAAAAATKRDRKATERARQDARRELGDATLRIGTTCRPSRQPSRLLEAAIEVARKEPLR